MANWYVYHSAETMDRRYGNPDKNHVFSEKQKRKLCLNDEIWVIEGYGESPKTFYLAAHFVYKETDYPPFPSPYKGPKYDDFNFMYAGPGESFGSEYELNASASPWFEELHKKFITKQKFFHSLEEYPGVVNGFKELVSP